ncbi:hypothetical protein SESBI_47144 [Sesbania bispinosa]|nr:hypothetical protein SESBI_47144 [Sesbania bispinosa]
MFPLSPIWRNPVELSSGLSLFATQTTVLSAMFLYHMPKYQLELVPEKKPRTKTWLGDSRVWLVLRNCDAVKVSAEEEIVGKKVCEVMKQKRKRRRRLVKVKALMFAEYSIACVCERREMKCMVGCFMSKTISRFVCNKEKRRAS